MASAGASENGETKLPSSTNVTAHSPSPSPALSAYTSSASSSCSDYDLNSLSLDDWGYPTRTSEPLSPGWLDTKSAVRSSSASRDLRHMHGAATPTASRSSSMRSDGALQSLAANGAKDTREEDGQDGEIAEVEDDEDADLQQNGFDVEDEDEEDMHACGVPAARGWRLEASKAKTPEFRAKVLAMFTKELKLETWSDDTANRNILPLSEDSIELKRISGAFSNAVFFVSYKAPREQTGPRTVLLRVYGSGTEVLLSRRTELLILHTLSSLYEIGPHILGTFANGRVETFFDAQPIGKDGIRDLGDRRETIRDDGSLYVRGREGRAQWVARRMRQLHEVPLETMRAVLEQGDLRTGGEGSSTFGRGIENHLFARSHRPAPKRTRASVSGQAGNYLDAKILTGQTMGESPAPIGPSDGSKAPDTSITASGIDGIQTQGMAIRGFPSLQRNSSVASFDSLATSYNSQDGSISSGSTDNLLISPGLGPSSYSETVAAARKGQIQSPYTFNTPAAKGRRGSSASRASSASKQPYPGVWRRTKRWAREAGKVFALVDEFGNTEHGQQACRDALQGTVLQGMPFSPFPSVSPPRVHTLALGNTLGNLQRTLLAIASIDFPRLLKEMDAYKKFVRTWERANGPSRRVLTHCDTQYSNLLLIKDGVGEEAGTGMPRDRSRESTPAAEQSSKPPIRQKTRSRLAPYERLIVIDFEYCSPNPRAYDIANAFQEWRFDYHSPTDSWSPYSEPFPTQEERRRWLRAYVEQGRLLRMRGKTPKSSLDPQSANTPPAEELVLPPAILPASSQESFTTAESRKSTAAVEPTSCPYTILGGRNKSFSAQSLASPSLLDTASPSLNPTSSPMLQAKPSSLAALEISMEREIDRLSKEVEIFSVACHANWALWGITFAKEQIESLLEETLRKYGDDGEATLLEESDQTKETPVDGSAESFDNLRYALGRVELFREEIAGLGICV